MHAVFQSGDADGSGWLEYNEFSALVKVELAPKRRARIRREKEAKAAAAAAQQQLALEVVRHVDGQAVPG